MNAPLKPAPSGPGGFIDRVVLPALSRGYTQVLLGAAILLVDLATGRYLQFPILFVVPVTLSAFYSSIRLAYALAILLPLGRLFIAAFIDNPAPFLYSVTNGLIRVVVLCFIAWLAGRSARQKRELQDRVDTLVTICAWSRTVEYQGEWISIEEYLRRRFNVTTSHGISPAQAEKLLGGARINETGNSKTDPRGTGLSDDKTS